MAETRATGGAVIVAGLDPARVPWTLDALGPSFCVLEGRAAGHALLSRLRSTRASLALLGPWLPDLSLAELVRRIRADPETRRVSVVALVLGGEGAPVPGANSVLPLETDTATLEKCVSRLRTVPPRVRVSARVRGKTVATHAPFFGVTHDVSVGGMKVRSRDTVTLGMELDLWLELPAGGAAPVLGRVARSDRGYELTSVPRNYGVEFLYVPPATEEALVRLIDGGRLSRPAEDTLCSGCWTYEVLGPVRRGNAWEAEVWRAHDNDPRGERFFTVSGTSARNAVREAREVLLSWAIVRNGSRIYPS